MKWFKPLTAALAALIAIAAAIPFFVSLDQFIPAIEQQASARLNEPVTVKSLQFSVLPVPHLTVDGITIGKALDIKLGTVSITPALLSLLSETRVIKSIELKSLELTPRALEKIPVWSKQGDAGAAPLVRIESIRLDDALVNFDKTAFGPFDGRVSLDSTGHPIDALLTTQDGKLRISVKPDKANFHFDAFAKGWTPPAGPPIEFDELVIQGVATLDGADFSQIAAKLYGGTANGKATAAWRKGLLVKGRFELQQVELKSLVPLVSPGTKVSGQLNAQPIFSASAADATRLLNALHLETRFNLQNGVLYGVDLVKAATSLLKQGAAGGETHFDHLSGHLVRDRGAHQFTQLKISSGALAAEGNVNISAKQDLSGRVTAQVKAAGTSANIPLNVAGTLHAPLLYPTGGTIAGAAIGTVLMPGVGTGIGARAGQAIENLFGKKK